jgi:penicillin-binding protein 2
VLAGLLRAVGSREGTAAGAFAGFPLDRVPVEGKTGTAQVTGKADTALFAAVAPAGDPRFAVVAVVEEAGFGSAVAAPVVRRVLEVLFGIRAEPPSPPGPR